MFGGRASFFKAVFGADELFGNYEQNQRFLAFQARFRRDPIIPGWQSAEFVSSVTGQGPIKAGVFRFDNVAELRATALELLRASGYRAVNFAKGHVVGDSRALHSVHKNGLFQAASQFNCLEFVGPQVTPEAGITCYQNDRTQGPVCAIACAAATAFRNYLVPVDAKTLSCGNLTLPEEPLNDESKPPIAFYGQTQDKQLNGLADLEPLLWKEFAPPGATTVMPMWTVKNGYIELSPAGQIHAEAFQKKASSDPDWEQRMVNTVRVGSVFDCEVTDARIGVNNVGGEECDTHNPPTVSQVFASACSIGYSYASEDKWEPLGKLVLKAAYEATFYSYLIHACRSDFRRAQQPTAAPVGELLLTKLGGGVFANPSEWINDAMIHAQSRVELLFSELRKQESASGAAGAAPSGLQATAAQATPREFPFRVLVTHYGGVEPGYDGFVKGPSRLMKSDEDAEALMARVPSFMAGLDSGLMGGRAVSGVPSYLANLASGLMKPAESGVAAPAAAAAAAAAAGEAVAAVEANEAAEQPK